MDIVVANDTVPNFLFENNGDGKFSEVARSAGIAFDRSGHARGAMGIDCGYLRNDDTLAIRIGNFANEPSALFMSRASKRQFVDAAMYTGFGPPTRLGLTFGLAFVDFDLDGRLDVLGANGHLQVDIARTQATQQYAQPPQAFWNAGMESSSELVLLGADSVGDSFQVPIVGRGAAYGDLDGDGDQDLVITTSHGPAKIFRNDQATSHEVIRVHLIGNPDLPNGCNRDAIGAVVTLKVGNVILRRCVSSTCSYLSQSELVLTFGLGNTFQNSDPEIPLSLIVQWPGGQSETFLLQRTGMTQMMTQSDEDF